LIIGGSPSQPPTAVPEPARWPQFVEYSTSKHHRKKEKIGKRRKEQGYPFLNSGLKPKKWALTAQVLTMCGGHDPSLAL
jgi:hypothetical protein